MLGGSSIVAIAMTLATAKGLALLVGPHGVGSLALLQSVADLAALVAGVGVSVSLVRLVADALDRQDSRQVTAVRAASSVLAWSLGGIAAIVLILMRDPISFAIFGSTDSAASIVVVSLAVPLALAGAANVATLSAYGEVGAIASVRTVAVVVMAFATLLAVALLGEAGVSLGILASSLGLWLGSTLLLRWRTTLNAWPGWSAINSASRELVRFGAPFAGSALVGTGMQLAIPILVALQLSTDSAGQYRAATQISAGYLAFIAAAMLQDYYPRLSGQQTRPDVLISLIDQQLMLVMILTVPLILVGLALSQVIVPLLYSPAFEPAVAILSWQLVGTLLRLPSWTLSFAILARGRSRVYFAVELVGGIVLVVGSVAGMELFGLAGLGVAVLATYLIYYPIVWLAVRRDLPLRVTPAQRVLLLTTASALAVQAMPALGLDAIQQPLAAALAVASVVGAGLAARRVFGGRDQGADGAHPGPSARGRDGGESTPDPEPSRVQ